MEEFRGHKFHINKQIFHLMHVFIYAFNESFIYCHDKQNHSLLWIWNSFSIKTQFQLPVGRGQFNSIQIPTELKYI